MNTGQEIIDSENGLLATLAFQLGPKEKPFYALEGAAANAGAAINWLKHNLSIDTELPEDNSSVMQNYSTLIDSSAAMMSSYTSGGGSGILEQNGNTSTDVIFVPAFTGLHSPFWKHDSRGFVAKMILKNFKSYIFTFFFFNRLDRLILGLNPHTTTRQITLAAYEAICFQTRDLIESLAKDLRTWPKLEKLTVGGGEFIEKPFLLQLLADICGITIERPQTSSPSCLGAMLAAGAAMKVLTLDNCVNMLTPPSDVFQPTMCANRKAQHHTKLQKLHQITKSFFAHSKGHKIQAMETCNKKMFKLGFVRFK